MVEEMSGRLIHIFQICRSLWVIHRLKSWASQDVGLGVRHQRRAEGSSLAGAGGADDLSRPGEQPRRLPLQQPGAAWCSGVRGAMGNPP